MTRIQDIVLLFYNEDRPLQSVMRISDNRSGQLLMDEEALKILDRLAREGKKTRISLTFNIEVLDDHASH